MQEEMSVRFQREVEALISDLESVHKDLFATAPETQKALKEMMEIRLQMKLLRERGELKKQKWNQWVEFRNTHEGTIALLGIASTLVLGGFTAIWVSWVARIIMHMWN